MSHHYVTVKELPAGGERLSFGSVKFSGLLLPAAAIGLIVSFGILFFGNVSFSATGSDGKELHYTLAQAFSFSWLFAFFFFFTLAMGGTFWTLLHNVSNSSWGVAVRRCMEQLGGVMPGMAVFAIPFFFPSVRESLYVWIRESNAAMHDHGGMSLKDALLNAGNSLLAHKSGFLNNGFALVRLATFFIVFGGCFLMFQRAISIQQDGTGDIKNTLRTRFHSSWLMILFALTITFSGIDLIKSLNYWWASTMFGVNVFAGTAWSSMALLIVTVTSLKLSGKLDKVVSLEHLHIMGKFQFAFTVFWAYITYSQYMLIWYANIPEETGFYAIRNTGGWNIYTTLMVIFHFFVPFVLLIIRNNKKNLRLVRLIAILVLFMHLAEVYWWVIPMRGPMLADRPTIGWTIILDVLAFLSVGAGFAYLYLRNLTSASLYPVGDPRLQESINMVN